MFRNPFPRLNAVVATIEPTKAPTTGIGITVCPIAAPIAAPVASIAFNVTKSINPSVSTLPFLYLTMALLNPKVPEVIAPALGAAR